VKDYRKTLLNSAVKRKTQQGLSLVELLFTISFLGVIITVFFNLLPSSVMSIRHAQHILDASMFAQSILEEKRAGAFFNLDDPPVISNAVGDDGTPYTYVYETFDVAGADPSHLKGIRVTVTWKEKTRQYSISKELYVFCLKR
jgi:Tfp pilus assembly protein PilV